MSVFWCRTNFASKAIRGDHFLQAPVTGALFLTTEVLCVSFQQTNLPGDALPMDCGNTCSEIASLPATIRGANVGH